MVNKDNYNSDWIRQYSTEIFEKEYTYYENDLGVTLLNDRTIFKIWSPVAKKICISLYESGNPELSDKIKDIDMLRGEKGVWFCEIEERLENIYYTFTATFENGENTFCDPYAKAVGVNGKRAMIIDLEKTNPVAWNEDKNPNESLSMCETIIYELHTRDFSADQSSGIKNKGKFLGIVEENTTVNNENEISTGIDYLKKLGITHLHLLPFYDYATIDESKNFDTNAYSWGYDPLNFNVPEGSYSTDPYDGSVRVKELKKMIQKLHQNGISLVMDVVYNHTYNEEFCFNKAVPGYFHRISPMGEFSNGSVCGNDTASERSMVSKYIVDSVLYWAKEYHIDGFRFDLVGLIDVETMNQIRDCLDQIRPGILLYGEGWNLETKVTKKNVILATQNNIDKLHGFAMFNDNIRDAIKGSVFEKSEKGFISGNTSKRKEIIDSVLGMPEWCDTPKHVVNYESCHDNYTLFDKIHICNPGISMQDAVKQNLLAASIIMLSEGIPLIHAGEEILRSKKRNDGEYVSDSVWEPDYVNSIKWDNLKKEEYKKVYNYYKGLIEFRKNHQGLHLENKTDIQKSIKILNLNNNDDHIIAYEITNSAETIVVIFNSLKENITVNLGNENEKFVCYINDQYAGNKPLSKESNIITVAGVSCMVLLKE